MPSKKIGKRLWVASLLLVSALALFLIASTSYNAVVTHRFWAAYGEEGKLISVGQARMYINCSGTGSPALILESGLGDSSIAWAAIQPALSKNTRVCSYDRLGVGYSDDVSEPRDAARISSELHNLLDNAHIPGPYVLMGHSIGGLYVREFAMQFPKEVAGLILVDATPPYLEKNPLFAHEVPTVPQWLVRAAFAIGAVRLTGRCSHRFNNAQFDRLEAEDQCRMRYKESAAELESFDDSSAEVTRKPLTATVPLLIFSHDPEFHVDSLQDRMSQQEWSKLQEQYKLLSQQSERIIAISSTHYVMVDRPDLVIRMTGLFMASLNRPEEASLLQQRTKRE